MQSERERIVERMRLCIYTARTHRQGAEAALDIAIEELAKVASPNRGPGIFTDYEEGQRDAAARIRVLGAKEVDRG